MSANDQANDQAQGTRAITRILVANRGEIARRVFATARRLGIETVAVYSDADADLPFVREADYAVRLPGNTPTETYLRADLVLDAAHRTGADAIHPGYGFLSENAGFARAVEAAGLTWVGPAPESIEQMGSKIESKRLMAAAGVPVLEAPESPTAADLPLLVKASAGGGGRGMRVVRDLDALADEIAAAESEAASAFGDGTVFVEPYVERGRHVEVQVVGYPDGVLVLGERDCSLQRRHQKVVEEAPAPLLPTQTREALHEAARKAAAAIDYRGAGTVEFLYDGEADRFFFLEMNTRLQVEHPVTEAVHGVDLVELQLEVAEGATTPPATTEPSGHAIEVRLYAEDPAADYQPQSGPLLALEVDHDVAFGELAHSGVRLDSGFEGGNEVGTHYDAMLAKVIAWAPTRAGAARRLASALGRAQIAGITTNREQLVRILRDEDFLAGRVSTAVLAERADLHGQEPDERTLQLAGFVAAIGQAEAGRATRRVQQRIPIGWRNVVSQPQSTPFDGFSVEWYPTRTGYRLADDSATARWIDNSVELTVDGVCVRNHGPFDPNGDTVTLRVPGPDGLVSVVVRRVPRFIDPAEQVSAGSLLAQMPGTIIEVLVGAGEQVEAGQKLLVMEAMKMQHTVVAPTAGTVTEINVQPSNQVAAGEVLAVVEENES